MTRRDARRIVLALTICVTGTSLVSAQKDKGAAKEQDSKRPKVTLRAQPSVGVAPARIVLTGELQGGADDFEEFYCPSVEWQWGDDTTSGSSSDCEPYEAGKSQIKRRFTVEHTFKREGAYKVYFHLKRKEKFLGSASVTIQIQPGGRAVE
jgi:hypothetical protein